MDGQWSDFGDWGTCSGSCGGNGTQSRTRFCDRPALAHGGKECSGESTEYQDCINDNCPGKTIQYLE